MSEEIAAKLDEARALIEKGWAQHEDAYDAEGCVVPARSARATRWCAWGAIDAVTSRGYVAANMRNYFREAVVGGVTAWNDEDGRTRAEVIEAFRKAAALARGEAA